MTQTLPSVAHEHHDRILHAVDLLPELADLLLVSDATDIHGRLNEMSAFLTGTVLPHVEAAEASLYPELERMLQNRHSMTPMRAEHAEIRRIVADFADQVSHIEPGRVRVRRALALRRVMFRLYALLKVHLAEEELYVRVVDHGVSADVAEMLVAGMAHPQAVHA